MFTASDHFVLKHSRLSIVFQCCFFVFLCIVFFLILPGLLWLCLSFLALIFLIIFRKRKQVESLQHLDQLEWSLKYYLDEHVYPVKLSHLINHSLYIVIYFHGKNPNSCIIWRDQVDEILWKRLLMRVNLQ